MTLAAIDIGTNSVKLLIGRVIDRKVTPLLHRSVTTRLGEGLQKSGEISSEAADRTLEALAEFRSLAENRGSTRTQPSARSRSGRRRTAAHSWSDAPARRGWTSGS